MALEFSKAVTAARAITPTWTNFFRVIIEKRALQLAYQSGSFIYTAVPQLLMKVEYTPRGRCTEIQTCRRIAKELRSGKDCRAEAARGGVALCNTSLQNLVKRLCNRSVFISVEIVFVFGSRFSNRQNGDGPGTFKVCSRIGAAEERRRSVARTTFPPRYLGGYGSCGDS